MPSPEPSVPSPAPYLPRDHPTFLSFQDTRESGHESVSQPHARPRGPPQPSPADGAWNQRQECPPQPGGRQSTTLGGCRGGPSHLPVPGGAANAHLEATSFRPLLPRPFSQRTSRGTWGCPAPVTPPASSPLLCHSSRSQTPGSRTSPHLSGGRDTAPKNPTPRNDGRGPGGSTPPDRGPGEGLLDPHHRQLGRRGLFRPHAPRGPATATVALLARRAPRQPPAAATLQAPHKGHGAALQTPALGSSPGSTCPPPRGVRVCVCVCATLGAQRGRVCQDSHCPTTPPSLAGRGGPGRTRRHPPHEGAMPGGRGLWAFRAATAGVRPACPNSPPCADGLRAPRRHPSVRRRCVARVRPRHGVHGSNDTDGRRHAPLPSAGRFLDVCVIGAPATRARSPTDDTRDRV